jgi:hypothetical protein
LPDGGDGDAILADKKTATTRGEAAQAPPPPPPPALIAQTSPAAAKPSPGKATAASAATAGDIAATRGPMLIYTANLTMAVFEVARALADLEELARDVGGFMARRDDRSITLRVPVARFDESLKRIAKLGDVLHRDVTAEDITEEFHDLEVRIKNLHAIRDRLEQLLARAAKVEDSLLIERELDRVAAEIDRIEGRMKFLRDRASYSTITVAFQPRSSEAVSKTPFHLPVPWLNELGLGRLLSL